MFQCVMLSVSSNVILFHRERKECGPKNGKIKGKSVEKAPDYKVGKRRGTPTAAPNRGKEASKERETEANRKDATKTAKEKL